jgi:hypothetical protein
MWRGIAIGLSILWRGSRTSIHMVGMEREWGRAGLNGGLSHATQPLGVHGPVGASHLILALYLINND